MKVDAQSGLQNFAKKRSFLLEKYHEVLQLYERLELVDELEMAKNQCQHLENECFKVLVVGEFKRGKSTFINALLGEEILPAYSIPCTAVINEVKYSEEKKAVLHFEKNLPGNLSQLRPEVREHIAKYSGKAGEIPPMEIPVEDIEKYVVIADPGKDQAESVAESPYSRVELFWPIDLCRNQVEIVDSPGLNEHGTRTKVTKDYLAKADAIIFVLSCQALGSASEMSAIADIKAIGFNELFFVCNFFDQVRERERARLVNYAQDKLKEYTTLDGGIHFISALNALNAKHDAEQVALQQSGFSDFEKRLIGFLVNGRGRLKLLNPANMLHRQLSRVLRETVSVRRAMMLGRDPEKLQRRYEMEKPKLERAEKLVEKIYACLLQNKEQICENVRLMTLEFHQDLADAVPSVIMSYELENRISVVFSGSHEEECAAMCKEISQRLQIDIAECQRKWIQNMRERINSDVDKTFNNIMNDIDEFQNLITDVVGSMRKENVVGSMRKENDEQEYEEQEEESKDDIPDCFGNILLDSNNLVNYEGFGGMGKTAALVAAGVGASFITAWALPAVLWGAFKLRESAEEKIKNQLAKSVQDNLLKQAEGNAGNVAGNIAAWLDGDINKITAFLLQRIDNVSESVNTVLLQMKKDEEEMEEQCLFLDEQHRVGVKLVEELESFADQLS